MTTLTKFDVTEVSGFAADLDASMNRCDNGEGMECATLDATLRHYANLCCAFREEVRKWFRAVFAGKVEFDPEVESVWKNEGARLFERACSLWDTAQMSEGSCYILDGKIALGSALWGLQRLLQGWVTPMRALSPAPRVVIPEAAAQEIKQRLKSLSPLPVE